MPAEIPSEQGIFRDLTGNSAVRKTAASQADLQRNSGITALQPASVLL
jgi:hypothetical protein